jgi:LacI family transcriptional regulator
VNLADPFFGLMIQGMIEASARADYFVTLSKVTVDMEQDFPRRVLHGQHFDGVLTFALDIDDPLLPSLTQHKRPLVVWGSHPRFVDLTWVDAQQQEGAHSAVRHLLTLGHRRIAMITGLLHDVAALERRDGYTQALAEAGLPIAPELIVEGDWTPHRGYDVMQHLLGLAQRPTAVFVANDMMALGVIRAINEAGLTVPHDVALVSFDDLPIAMYASPPLTTIRTPFADAGAIAVKLLIEQIEQRNLSTMHVRLPTELVIRESCGASESSRN